MKVFIYLVRRSKVWRKHFTDLYKKYDDAGDRFHNQAAYEQDVKQLSRQCARTFFLCVSTNVNSRHVLTTTSRNKPKSKIGFCIYLHVCLKFSCKRSTNWVFPTTQRQLGYESTGQEQDIYSKQSCCFQLSFDCSLGEMTSTCKLVSFERYCTEEKMETMCWNIWHQFGLCNKSRDDRNHFYLCVNSIHKSGMCVLNYWSPWQFYLKFFLETKTCIINGVFAYFHKLKMKNSTMLSLIQS